MQTRLKSGVAPAWPMCLGSPQLDIAELKQPVGQKFPHQVSGSYETEIGGE